MTEIPTTPVDPAPLEAAYLEWVDRIEANHHGRNHRANPAHAFTPLANPLAETRMALVTTAGAHLDDQEPFHVETVAGDQSFRIIPDDVDLARLRFTHTHYDTASAEQDPNCVLPRDTLRAAVDAGRIGEAAPFHVGMMGFNPDPTEIAEATGPAVAALLADAGVGAVVLVPG